MSKKKKSKEEPYYWVKWFVPEFIRKENGIFIKIPNEMISEFGLNELELNSELPLFMASLASVNPCYLLEEMTKTLTKMEFLDKYHKSGNINYLKAIDKMDGVTRIK